MAPVLTRRVSVVGGQVTTRPLFLTDVLAIGGERIGYMVVNDFIAPAEAPLVAAIERFPRPVDQRPVLDLRYNGGGYLYLASELAYMIAGAGAHRGRCSRATLFNNKRIEREPDTPFFDLACVPDPTFRTAAPTQPLPTLNLPRVFVLTGPPTPVRPAKPSSTACAASTSTCA